MDLWILTFVLYFLFGQTSKAVEVHFENKDGGFFLKHVPRQHYQSSSDLSGTSLPPSVGSLSSSETVLSVDRFTVFQNSQPISVRATYGPFSTKQTVPARYIVPDPLDPVSITEKQQKSNGSSSLVVDMQELSAAATHHLDMSAHIVRHEIPRDSPVLRVLFHTGSDPGGRRQFLLSRHQRVCIVLHATLPGRIPLTSACSPDGEDGVCLAQIAIPSKWWPPLPPPDSQTRPLKTPPRLVHLAYSVLEPKQGCVPRVQIQPVTPIGTVSLVPAKSSYKELRADEYLTMLVPHTPLYPLSRIHIPVFLQESLDIPITMFIVRARVKSGLRILGAEPSNPHWNITTDLNPKRTGATVTAIYRDNLQKNGQNHKSNSVPNVNEIFTWLLEVAEDSAELWDGARIVWTVRYLGAIDIGSSASQKTNYSHNNPPVAFQPITNPGITIIGGEHVTSAPHVQDLFTGSQEGRKKLTARLEVQKDDIQAVLPISKNWEVMNTAVLTGRQVSQTMKVFIVSQAGKAADVTLQSSCHSEDESVLKVSSSCSSVYVDGTEARGSVNGSVLVKYGTYTGLAQFTVWMPEFPLEITVPDVRLSQIKSWKVLSNFINPSKANRQERSYGWPNSDGGMFTDEMNGIGTDQPVCRLRYQQTPVDVYGRFLATDHDSGRISYFISRRSWLRVTDLVTSLLRVSDPRIATLSGRILQGHTMGRSEVQVLSPITGRVIGAKEIRVVNDKVSLTKLAVSVVSGLQLNISPDSTIENGYIAETSVTKRLTAQYQEGLLDIELEFSDGSKIPLRDVNDADYHLVVESLNSDVVAFAPMVASHHPRVIAIGEGSGDLLKVTLLLNDECRLQSRAKPTGKSNGILAFASTTVDVDFSAAEIPHRPDFVQNDGGMPLKDEHHHEPTVQARQHHSIALGPHGRGVPRHAQYPVNMTPLEIGMYVLLAAFCFAIVVFVVSCIVYASKFKPQNLEGGVILNGSSYNTSNNSSMGMMRETRKTRPTTLNAHDWVWLGRATIGSNGQSYTNSRCFNNNNNTIGTDIEENLVRITANPMNMNYSDPDDCLINPQIEMPSRSVQPIDTATYSKRNSNSHKNYHSESNEIGNRVSKLDIPPAVPAHGISLNKDLKQPIDDKYKPPVPPHRNIGVTAQITPNNSDPDINKKHHKHYRKNNVANNITSDLGACLVPDIPKNAFTFDDALPSTATGVFQQEILQLAEKNKIITDLDEDKIESTRFVEFPKDAVGNSSLSVRGNSPEVKTATIVGNPMFGSKEIEAKSTTPANTGELEELQLDMDYDQILNYFNNLKESNA